MYFSHFVFFLFFHHFILFMFTDFFFFSNAHSVNNNDYSNVLQWLLTFCHSSSNNTKTYCFVVDSSVCRRERKKEKFNDRKDFLTTNYLKEGTKFPLFESSGSNKKQGYLFSNRVGQTRQQSLLISNHMCQIQKKWFQIAWVEQGTKFTFLRLCQMRNKISFLFLFF